MARKLYFYLVLVVCVFCLGWADSALALDVVRVTPVGKEIGVLHGKITIKFNTPVVSFGDESAESKDIGIKITPAIDCEARWTAPDLWTCRIKSDYYDNGTWHSRRLKYATPYTITIPKGIKALDGSILKEDVVKSFETARPRIIRSYYHNLSPLCSYWGISTV